VAWAIGTCVKTFVTEVQYGHVGSMVNSELVTADAKNQVTRKAGFVVTKTFEELQEVLRETYEKLVAGGVIRPKPEREPLVIPMDYKWADFLFLSFFFERIAAYFVWVGTWID
jgi:ATP citrate (pro-S)-lyase